MSKVDLSELHAANFLNENFFVSARHIGNYSNRRDIEVTCKHGTFEIEVKRILEPWREQAQKYILRRERKEFLEIPGLGCAVVIWPNERTSYRHIENTISTTVQMMQKIGRTHFDAYELSAFDVYSKIQEFDAILIDFVENFRNLKIHSISIIDQADVEGIYQMLPMNGWSWGGKSDEFDLWLSDLLESGWFMKKLELAKVKNDAPFQFFLWIDGSSLPGIFEWLERGNHAPNQIDIKKFGLSGLWIATYCAAPSFVFHDGSGWIHKHNGNGVFNGAHLLPYDLKILR